MMPDIKIIEEEEENPILSRKQTKDSKNRNGDHRLTFFFLCFGCGFENNIYIYILGLSKCEKYHIVFHFSLGKSTPAPKVGKVPGRAWSTKNVGWSRGQWPPNKMKIKDGRKVKKVTIEAANMAPNTRASGPNTALVQPPTNPTIPDRRHR